MAKFYTPTKLSENMHETPEGYLVCVGVPIARTGWQKYADGETPLECDDNGVVMVHRDTADVFHPHHIASYQGKSVTIRHPTDWVTPQNWSMLSHGVVQNPRRGPDKDDDGEEMLLADLLITHAMAIGLVKNGLREVSSGYEAEYEQIEPGKGRQTNMVGNHVALVEEGRAGPRYAIADHKNQEEKEMSKLAEILKKRFGTKVIDEAMAEAAKEEKKDDKASDASAMDELVNLVKDLGAKVDGMLNAGKDEKEEEPKKKEEKADDESEKEEPKKKEEKADDEEAGEEGSAMESRIKALEAAVAQILEKLTDEGESEEMGDEDSDEEDGEEMGDSKLTGDEIARVEILAPGLKVSKGVDPKIKALEVAYATKEGKALIQSFTGGKKPVYDSAEKINTIFLAASECLKAQRGTGLEGSKNPKSFSAMDSSKENTGKAMTPEEMNKINEARYAQKK